MSEEKVPQQSCSAADVREFVHDLRNSLYVLRMGLEMLPEIRGDQGRFQELLTKLEAEQLAATQRLDQFSRAFGRQNG